MYRFLIPSFSTLFDQPGDPGGGGAPAGAPAAPASSPASQPPAASGGPASGGPAAAAGGDPNARPAEDRSHWIPPYRFNELSQRLEQMRRQGEEREARIRSVFGVEPPANPQHQQIRAALLEIMPELGLVGNKRQQLERLLQFAESGQLDQLGQSETASWERHGTLVTQTAEEQFTQATGITLGGRRMARELLDFIEEDRTRGRQKRYERADPSLVKEFVTELTKVYGAGRQPLAGPALVQQNRRLPAPGARGGMPPNLPAKRDRKQVSDAARQFVMQQGG